MPFAWLVLSGALAAALAPISGPFVATESFWSRLPAAVRPCGSAAELIGRRDASDRIANCVSVSLAAECIGIILSGLTTLSPSPQRAPDRRRAGRGRRIRRSSHRRVYPAGARAP